MFDPVYVLGMSPWLPVYVLAATAGINIILYVYYRLLRAFRSAVQYEVEDQIVHRIGLVLRDISEKQAERDRAQLRRDFQEYTVRLNQIQGEFEADLTKELRDSIREIIVATRRDGLPVVVRPVEPECVLDRLYNTIGSPSIDPEVLAIQKVANEATVWDRLTAEEEPPSCPPNQIRKKRRQKKISA